MYPALWFREGSAAGLGVEARDDVGGDPATMGQLDLLRLRPFTDGLVLGTVIRGAGDGAATRAAVNANTGASQRAGIFMACSSVS